MNQRAFLSTLSPKPLNTVLRHGLEPVGLYVGKGSNAMEVAVAKGDAQPNRAMLLDFMKARRDRRSTPVLAVVLHPGGVSFCGATGDNPSVHMNVDEGQLERLCLDVLDQPDRHAALRFLGPAQSSLNEDIPGICNKGLVALHHLRKRVPRRDDWDEANRKSSHAVGKRDGALLSALGFMVTHLDSQTNLLCNGEERTAVAVMLRETESPESGGGGGGDSTACRLSAMR